MAGNLAKENSSGQKRDMQKIIYFFEEHIAPHAAWEERKLYPAVDKRTSKGGEAFTTSMRYEHKLVTKWVKNLKNLSNSQRPDITQFVRKTDQLLGLILAHFEEEEEVLLPILDQEMTQKQFQQEILSK